MGDHNKAMPRATPRATAKGLPTQKHIFIGGNMEEEEARIRWGHPIILPKRCTDEPGKTQQPEEPNLDPSGPQATGWLKGLEHMNQICQGNLG